MKVAIDEGPGPQIKYQNPELNKLHQVVSQLIRCTDISSICQCSQSSIGVVLPNPFIELHVTAENLLPLSKDAHDILFGRSRYMKK